MKNILLIILTTLLCGSFAFAKGDIAKGKKKSVTCASCHGAKGISAAPIWPNLAGQKAAYMVKQLKDFKSGKRKDPSMGPMAKPLSPKDMEDVSAYYESLK